jgi:hypothetical protein
MGLFGSLFRTLFGGDKPAAAPAAHAHAHHHAPTSTKEVKAVLKAALATVGSPHYHLAIEEGGPSSAVAEFAVNVVSGSSDVPADALFSIDQPGFRPADVRNQIRYGGLLIIIGAAATGSKLEGYLLMSKGPDFAVYRRI